MRTSWSASPNKLEKESLRVQKMVRGGLLKFTRSSPSETQLIIPPDPCEKPLSLLYLNVKNFTCSNQIAHTLNNT